MFVLGPLVEVRHPALPVAFSLLNLDLIDDSVVARSHYNCTATLGARARVLRRSNSMGVCGQAIAKKAKQSAPVDGEGSIQKKMMQQFGAHFANATCRARARD